MTEPSTGTVLVINAGSSSVKYALLSHVDFRELAGGIVDRIGTPDSTMRHRDPAHGVDVTRTVATPDNGVALAHIVDAFATHGTPLDEAQIVAVGHRVVMGGAAMHEPHLVTPDVLANIEALAPLAPLHNPANAAAIRAAQHALPSIPHVAVFDTAFFHDLPPTAARYAINFDFAQEHAIRRYGFHGISHAYVSAQTTRLVHASNVHTNRANQTFRQVVLHLGNGASASAIVDGRPVETTMGFTPLEGLVMGTRTGDIDPAVVFYLHRTVGLSIDAIDAMLNRASGLAGMAGSNDMRDIHAAIDNGDPKAQAAFDIYVHRLRKTIGAFAAIMGGIDALTFTAGIGENDARLRAATVATLGHLGIDIDPVANDAPGSDARVISPPGSQVTVLVVPTNEEASVARDVLRLLATDTSRVKASSY